MTWHRFCLSKVIVPTLISWGRVWPSPGTCHTRRLEMKSTIQILVLSGFMSVNAAAQTQGGAQAGAQASTGTSVQAGDTKAQTSGSGNANAAAAANPGQASGSLASGTALNAELKSPVDAKKAKAGDAVTAQTTEAVKSNGKVVVPRGTKLLGHVTQASARGKGDAESALGIQFDKAVLKNGEEMPLNVTIQAIASAQSAASVAGAEADSYGSAGASAAGGAARSGGGALGGVASSAGATAGVAGSSAGAVGGLNAAGQLASNSRGVFGLNGLSLNGAASNTTQGSLITSAGK